LELEEHKRPPGLVDRKQPKVGIKTTRYVADDQVAARPASALLSRVQNTDVNWPLFGTTTNRRTLGAWQVHTASMGFLHSAKLA